MNTSKEIAGLIIHSIRVRIEAVNVSFPNGNMWDENLGGYTWLVNEFHRILSQDQKDSCDSYCKNQETVDRFESWLGTKPTEWLLDLPIFTARDISEKQ